jgi:glutamine phosphoribosylpyrophosphate amidotransferase
MIRMHGCTDVRMHAPTGMRSIGVLDIMAHVHKTEDEERVAIRYQAALTVYNTFGKTMAQCSPFAKTRLVADEIKKLQGAYAFVLYDEKHRRIVAARDPEGIEPLYWGTCKDGTVRARPSCVCFCPSPFVGV